MLATEKLSGTAELPIVSVYTIKIALVIAQVNAVKCLRKSSLQIETSFIISISGH